MNKDISCKKNYISNELHDFFLNSPLKISDIQTYFPIMSDYFTFYNNNLAHTNYVLNSRYKLVSADKDKIHQGEKQLNQNSKYVGKIYDNKNKSSEIKEVFFKINPILDPLSFMMDKYPASNINSNLPYSPYYNDRKYEKIMSKNNSTYIDGFFYFLGSRLVEMRKTPSFPLFYGIFNGISDHFNFDISEEYSSYRNNRWFKKGLNEQAWRKPLFTIEKTLYIDSDIDSDISSSDDSDISSDNNSDNNSDCNINLFNLNKNNVQKMSSQKVNLDSINKDELSEFLKTKRYELNNEDLPELECRFDNENSEEENSEEESNEESDEESDEESEGENSEEEITEGNSEQDNESGSDEGSDSDGFKNLLDDISSNISEKSVIKKDEIHKECFAKLKNFPVQLICMESFENCLEDIIENDTDELATLNENILEKTKHVSENNSEKLYLSYYFTRLQLGNLVEKKEYEWSCYLFQICFGLAVAQKAYNFTHNDLHSNNIMFSETDDEYLYYKYNGKYYRIPTNGKIMKIIDFGRGVYNHNGNQYFSDMFKFDGEAGEQYTYPYEKRRMKGNIKPNPSFDLSRLSASIIEDLYPCPPKDKVNGKFLSKEGQKETVSELYNLLYSWITDKYGRLVTRYEDFDLYKIIARRMDNAIPKYQLEKDIFKHFIINKENIPENQWIYIY
tara:strand:- start:330 stop:2357 length:2028 start_codon:yes stop_codon:yes gene_type:complete